MIVVLLQQEEGYNKRFAFFDTYCLHFKLNGVIGLDGKSLHITVVDDYGYRRFILLQLAIVPLFKAFLDKIKSLVHKIKGFVVLLLKRAEEPNQVDSSAKLLIL
jgi:hypothetical protein